MPSYVITKWGKTQHIKARWLWPAMTLCGRRVWFGWAPNRFLEGGHEVCTRCLDRAARMSKREE